MLDIAKVKSILLKNLSLICEKYSIALDSDIEKFVELSDYTVEGRYSIIHDDLDESDKYTALLEKLLSKYL